MIYLDNAATTKMDDRVLTAMLPYFIDNFENPSSIYQPGIDNKTAIWESREKIAKLINATPSEIYFTSGGSESDNWVIKSAPKGAHIITSCIEHHAVLRSCEWLEKNGVSVTYLPVCSEGYVNIDDVKNAIRDNTYLISIMTANNEIGTIQPIYEIGRIASHSNILFHTDAVQAFGHIPLDVNEFNIDFLSCSSHKICGPKGVGALYVRNKCKQYLKPLIHGGGQEFNMRAGTENVPGIVGFGTAAEIAYRKLRVNMNREYVLNALLISELNKRNISFKINGGQLQRLPNNINISIDGIRGEELMMLLSMRDCYVSTGSACNSSSNEPSHVLKAIGLSDEEANSSIRITLSPELNENDIIKFVDILDDSIHQLS